jgi:hypothetical protein
MQTLRPSIITLSNSVEELWLLEGVEVELLQLHLRLVAQPLQIQLEVLLQLYRLRQGRTETLFQLELPRIPLNGEFNIIQFTFLAPELT